MTGFYRTVTDLVKKPEKGSFNADIGNLIHAALKEFRLLSKMPLENLVKMEAFNLELCLTPEKLSQATDLLQSFLKSPLAPPLNSGFHELPFRLKCGPAVITGIIDYTFETKEGWVICDFKTDSTFDKERYALQMDTYALALSKAKEKPVLETRLLFLRLNKTQIEPCTPKRLQLTEDKLCQLIK